jgi:hypothetical protein
MPANKFKAKHWDDGYKGNTKEFHGNANKLHLEGCIGELLTIIFKAN